MTILDQFIALAVLAMNNFSNHSLAYQSSLDHYQDVAVAEQFPRQPHRSEFCLEFKKCEADIYVAPSERNFATTLTCGKRG